MLVVSQIELRVMSCGGCFSELMVMYCILVRVAERDDECVGCCREREMIRMSCVPIELCF